MNIGQHKKLPRDQLRLPVRRVHESLGDVFFECYTCLDSILQAFFDSCYAGEKIISRSQCLGMVPWTRFLGSDPTWPPLVGHNVLR